MTLLYPDINDSNQSLQRLMTLINPLSRYVIYPDMSSEERVPYRSGFLVMNGK
nr:hypothetical protein Q903MT_gene4493 [Picea sitchensis]